KRLAGQGPFEQGKAIELVHRLARAMHRAHVAGVIHRDLKPSNIGFEPDGEPVVLDFGLARLAGTETSQTPDGAILGTPVYMAPEQARGDQEAIGPATDIYSLGVILYQLLTGQVPFSGPFAAVVAQILYGPCPSPLAVRPNLDLRLVDVCARAMARQPADRYPTMEAFAVALEAIGTPASLEGPSSGSPPNTREVTGGTAANLPPTLPTTPTDTTTGDEVPGTMQHREAAPPEPVRPWWASLPWPVRWPLLLFWWPLAWLATGAAWLVRRPRWLGGVVVLVLAGGLAVWLATRDHKPDPEEARIFRGHEGPVRAVALSPDGRLALSGSSDGSARLWDVETGEERRPSTHRRKVASVAFSDDGRYAAYGL